MLVSVKYTTPALKNCKYHLFLALFLMLLLLVVVLYFSEFIIIQDFPLETHRSYM